MKKILALLVLCMVFLMIGCFKHEHKWEGEWTIDKAATCTEEGEKSHHCSGCSERNDITKIEELGHSYSEWKVTLEATETEMGKKERICKNCNHKESEEIPVLEHVHTYSGDWEYDSDIHYQKSTCEHGIIKDEGKHQFIEENLDKIKKYVCSICGYNYSVSTRINRSSKWAEALNNMKNYTLFVDENTYIKYTSERLEYSQKYTISIGSMTYDEQVKIVYAKEGDVYACYVYDITQSRWLKDIIYEDIFEIEASLFDLILDKYLDATFNKKTQFYEVSAEDEDTVYQFTLGFEDGVIKSGQIEYSYGEVLKETYVIKDINETTVEIPEYIKTEQDIWEKAFDEKHMRNFTMKLTVPSGTFTYKSTYVEGNHLVEFVGENTIIYVKTKEGKYFKYENDAKNNWEMEEITDEDSIAELEYWTLSYIRFCPDFGYYFDEFVYNENTGLYVFSGKEGVKEITSNAPGALVYVNYNLVLVEIKDEKLIRVEAQISNQSVNNACRVAFSDYDTTIIELPKEYKIIK